MCLRRRFKKNEDVTIAAGAKELVMDLEERCCIRQLALDINMDDTTGTNQTRVIIKIDEDEVLNESISNLCAKYNAWATTSATSRPFTCTKYDDSAKRYQMIFLDLGRVERRFALFIENKDTSNPAIVQAGVIYDILED
ncbi:MAG: hypothetical protein DRP29_00245 [Thermodesulfobacteriota bacterium]|nr:MAG: hypothetical protein DRP29_00245 [Thermodesulfobacteriota bacterium]